MCFTPFIQYLKLSCELWLKKNNTTNVANSKKCIFFWKVKYLTFGRPTYFTKALSPLATQIVWIISSCKRFQLFLLHSTTWYKCFQELLLGVKQLCNCKRVKNLQSELFQTPPWSAVIKQSGLYDCMWLRPGCQWHRFTVSAGNSFLQPRDSEWTWPEGINPLLRISENWQRSFLMSDHLCFL